MELIFMLFAVGVVVILVGVMLVVAFTRKGSVEAIGMTKRRITLRSTASPDEVHAWLTQHCPTGYSVEDADPTRGIVLLSSQPTAFTWGFFYPVIICADGSETRVDLGIKSKLFQAGPLVTRAHRKLAHALADLTRSRMQDKQST